MIKIINNKIILNNNDYKCISGIYGAFNHDIDYCATLLDFGNNNYDNEKYAGYFASPLATISDNINKKDYKNIFIEVFQNSNYTIVDEENENYENYLKEHYKQLREAEDK